MALKNQATPKRWRSKEAKEIVAAVQRAGGQVPAGGALHLPTRPLHGSHDLLGFLGPPAFWSCLFLQRHTS